MYENHTFPEGSEMPLCGTNKFIIYRQYLLFASVGAGRLIRLNTREVSV